MAFWGTFCRHFFSQVRRPIPTKIPMVMRRPLEQTLAISVFSIRLFVRTHSRFSENRHFSTPVRNFTIIRATNAISY